MVFDAAAIGLEGGRLLVARAFCQMEIDQVAEREGRALFLPGHRGIAAGGNFGEQPRLFEILRK